MFSLLRRSTIETSIEQIWYDMGYIWLSLYDNFVIATSACFCFPDLLFYNCKYINIWNTLRRNSRQYNYPQQDKLLLGQITNSSIHDNNKYDTGLNLSLIEPNMYFAFINRNVRIFLFFSIFLDVCILHSQHFKVSHWNILITIQRNIESCFGKNNEFVNSFLLHSKNDFFKFLSNSNSNWHVVSLGGKY